MNQIVRQIKLGGVDPSVIRELSGIYKPFVKAFKELVSNAYDADADLVRIRLADDFTEIEISDYGLGMTPFEFRNDFTKVGGSYTRLQNETTQKGRAKIGSKGIGFLAVARYCSKMEVVSTTTRSHSATIQCRPEGKKIDLAQYFEVPIPRDLLAGRLSVVSLTLVSTERRKRLGKRNYTLDEGVIHLALSLHRSEWKQVEVEYNLDCRGLEFRAAIDFDYLLSLENKKDLEDIEDFCTMHICALDEKDQRFNQHYTKITLRGLKDFVVRELRAPRKSGNVRNIESNSGLERFLWHLQRCTPVKYNLPVAIQEKFGKGNLESPDIKYIERVIFSGPNHNETELRRPVWGGEQSLLASITDDVSVKVNIESNGLIARGYILGHTEIIYPAEYRRLAIRVRNVQIGAPNFFGVESTATGATKAALSQITGEINVLRGMDAIDALNPGRESFYEENPHFKLLKKYIVGEGETVRGLLGKVIEGILTRNQVVSAVNDQISRANQRRKTLLDLSMAITHHAMNTGYQDRLHTLFGETAIPANGLVDRPDYEILPERPIAGFSVKRQDDLEDDHLADFANRKVYFNFNHDRWSWRIFILDAVYEVVPKSGTETEPLCQLDTIAKRIYINWGHPVRRQMSEAAFIKSSVAWKVAYHANNGNIEDMMELALRILTFEGP